MSESEEFSGQGTPETTHELMAEEFCQLLRRIECEFETSQPRRQGSRDAVEGVIDRLVDRYLSGSLPEKPRNWSQEVLAHLLLRGKVSAWIRFGGWEMDDTCPEETRESLRLTVPSEVLARWRDAFERMSDDLDRLLTPSERGVLASVKRCSNLAEIARACRMTARDVRTRLRRIAVKARKLARSRPPCTPGAAGAINGANLAHEFIHVREGCYHIPPHGQVDINSEAYNHITARQYQIRQILDTLGQPANNNLSQQIITQIQQLQAVDRARIR